jgi:hypothetical protein
MTIMQSADAAPTTAQLQSLSEQRTMKSEVMKKFDALVRDIQKNL